MLNYKEAKFLLEVLDRAPITGHQEREDMTAVVAKIANMGNEQAKTSRGVTDFKEREKEEEISQEEKLKQIRAASKQALAESLLRSQHENN